MARLYQRFVKVLEKWPADESRLSKTLGTHLRDQGKLSFNRHGEFEGNSLDCERRIASLERIARNHWASKYPRLRQSNATGLSVEQCKEVLTKENVDALANIMEKPFILRSLLLLFHKKD